MKHLYGHIQTTDSALQKQQAAQAAPIVGSQASLETGLDHPPHLQQHTTL